MKPIVFQEGLITTGESASRRTGISSRALGAVGLACGVVGLVAVRVGAGSWMILGTAFVVWSISGWRLYFSDSVNNRAVRILGYVFLSTALLVAAAIISKLYLMALGPAWKL